MMAPNAEEDIDMETEPDQTLRATSTNGAGGFVDRAGFRAVAGMNCQVQ